MDEDKIVDRLGKLMRLAGDRANTHESELAAARVYALLEEHQLPLRFLVPVGTEVKVVPASLAKTAAGKAAIRTYSSRRVNVFKEIHRFKGPASQKSLAQGFIVFDRHGYLVFVPLRAVRVVL